MKKIILWDAFWFYTVHKSFIDLLCCSENNVLYTKTKIFSTIHKIISIDLEIGASQICPKESFDRVPFLTFRIRPNPSEKVRNRNKVMRTGIIY
jgi:hypothetical protein